MPGGDNVVGSGLESTSASGDMYGRVSYFHAGGIDRPLLITKEGVEGVVPRETWRGQFHKGTSPANGAVRDCTQGGQTGCLLIAWPGWKTSASHAWGSDAPAIDVWYGGLVDGMRDASGQMYMRNRYYDPATGQFTQTDPIGIAGGLNSYAFASGDPVSYSDPYGLCAAHLVQAAPSARAEDRLRVCPGGMTHAEYYAQEDGFSLASRPVGNQVISENPKWIVLMFIADEGDRAKFQGCPDRTITHEEYQGMFQGVWVMNPRDQSGDKVEVVYPTFRRLRFLRKMWYSGTVITREYGNRGAAGWVYCDSGAARFETAPFRWP